MLALIETKPIIFMRHLFLSLLLISSINTFGQTKSWNTIKLSKYFQLRCTQHKLKWEGRDTLLLSVYPTLTMNGTGHISDAFRNYKRRFEYLLQNKTSFKGNYDFLYPDTVRINKLYLDTLSRNNLFIKYLNQTLVPFKEKTPANLTYSRKELLDIASRFFYCEKVMPDTSIYWRVCIGLNGIRDVKWKKDYTLLEAFCFEAIFNYLTDQTKAGFMDNFISHTKELKSKFVAENGNTNGLLEYVRINTFDRMASDEILAERLFEYYDLNKNNLSFRIYN